MKQNKAIRLLFVVFFLHFLCTSYSQEKWSLERCIMYALENNIQIKQQELDTRVKENSLLQSKLDLLPSLNGNYGQSYTNGRALDPTTYTFKENQTVIGGNFSASSQVDVFSGLQKVNTIQQNQFDLKASLKDLEKLKNDISLNIAAAYLQILLNTELMTAAKSKYDVTLQQVERTKKLVTSGSLPRASLLEIQAQAAADELNVVNAQNSIDLSYLTLAQLLELDSTKDFEIEIPAIEVADTNDIVADVDQIFDISQNVLPQIRSAEYKLRSAQKLLCVARSGYSPRISVSGNISSGFSDARQLITGYTYETRVIGQTAGGEDVTTQYPVPINGIYPKRDQLSDNISKSLSFNISVPIFNGWYVNNNVSNAKISIQNYRYNLENSRNLLYKEIQQAYADARAALKKYKASEKALISMEESFGYTKQRFEVGLVNTVDFNVASNQLISTRSDLLQSKYEYIFKIKILDFYQGKPLSLKLN